MKYIKPNISESKRNKIFNEFYAKNHLKQEDEKMIFNNRRAIFLMISLTTLLSLAKIDVTFSRLCNFLYIILNAQ